MAINGIVHGSHESKIGIVEESTFGSPYAQAGVFIQLEADIPDPDYGVFQDNEPKNHGSRVLEDGQDYTTEKGGTRVIPIQNHIARYKDLAHFFYGVFQSVSENASTPFEKTFTWFGEAGTETTQPDFSADAGYFASIGIQDTIASNHRLFTSCICKSLTVSADLTSGDGRLRTNSEWISGFAALTNANLTGAWLPMATAYFDFSAPTIKTIGGSDVVLYGFSFTFNNNGVRVGNDTSGDAETYSTGIPIYDATGSMTVKYDANTDSLIADMLAGTTRAIQVATGTDGADGNVDFLFDECKILGIPKGYGDPEGQKITIDFTVKADASTGAHTTVTMSDTQDLVWPA